MTPEDLKTILATHALWLRGASNGKRANLSGANLSGANLSGANLGGANLRSAYLSRADLRGADLSRADLSDTDLSDTDLSRADLSRADLSRADLRGADLSRAKGVVIGPQRSDGYLFWLTRNADGETIVRAGCRTFTFPQARAHWEATRGGTPLGDETMAILNYLESRQGAML